VLARAAGEKAGPARISRFRQDTFGAMIGLIQI